jgi:hypothetical protein
MLGARVGVRAKARVRAARAHGHALDETAAAEREVALVRIQGQSIA